MSKKKNRLRARSSTAYQAGPGTAVTLAYELYDAEGELVEAADSSESLEFVFGYGQLSPALEGAIAGMTAGASKRVRLSPQAAFGERDPEAVICIAREELPEDVRVGDELTAESEDGSEVHLKVLELDAETATVDANHPLAGQGVFLDLYVEQVRPATEAELARAVELLASSDGKVPESLIPAARLLKRRDDCGPRSGETPPSGSGPGPD